MIKSSELSLSLLLPKSTHLLASIYDHLSAALNSSLAMPQKRSIKEVGRWDN